MLKKLIILLLLITYFIPCSYSKYKSTYSNEIIINNKVPTYTIKFNPNGGIGIMEDMKLSYGEIKKLNKNLYTKGRFTFNGWKSENNIFSDCEEVINLSSINNDIVNLYADWVDYRVYFQMPPDWGNNIYVYMYNEEDNLFNNAWPGNMATLIDSEKRIYSYLVDKENAKKYKHIIFSDINNNYTLHQTTDLDFSFNNLGQIYVPTIYSEEDKTKIYVIGDTFNPPSIYLWNDFESKTDIINKKISGNGFEYIIDNKYNKFILNSRYFISGEISIPNFSDLTYQNISNNRYIVYRYYYDSICFNYDNWLEFNYDIWKRNEYVRFLERMRNY